MPPPNTPLANLKGKKLDQLREMCRERGLSIYGTKGELQARLVNYTRESLVKEGVELGSDESAILEQVGKEEEEENSVISERKGSNEDLIDVMKEMFKIQAEEQKIQQERMMYLLLERDRRTATHIEPLNSTKNDPGFPQESGSEGSSSQGQSDQTKARHDVTNDREREEKDLPCIPDPFAWQISDLKWNIERLCNYLRRQVVVSDCRAALAALQKSEDRLGKLITERLGTLDPIVERAIKGEFQSLRERGSNVTIDALNYCQEREDQDKAGGLPAGLRVPEFHGDPHCFPAWMEAFEAVVHSNSRIAPFYKYQYLRQALKGTAANCLVGFSPLVENYTEALEQVKARFGQPRTIVRFVVRSIVDMSKPSSNEAKDIRTHFDSLQGKLLTLDKYVSKIKNPLEAVMLAIVEAKLTPELEQAWEKELVENFDDDEFVPLPRFCKWYSKQVRALEAVSLTSKKKPNFKAASSGVYSAQALVASVVDHLKCSFCGAKHNNHDCPRLQKESTQSRWEMAKRKKLCFRCLGEFTSGHACKGACDVAHCGGRHHRLLHYERRVPLDSSGSKPESAVAETVNRPGPSNSLVAVSTITERVSESSSIVPSVLVYLHGVRGSVKVRLALDSMCQDTFVSQNVSEAVGLCPLGPVSVRINGFGRSVTMLNTIRVSFAISRNKDSIVFPIDAILKPGSICANIEPVQVDWESCSHLKGLDLSNSQLSLGGEVDVLIGLNHYMKIVEGTIIRHPSRLDLPAALSTAFGFVVFGPSGPNARLIKIAKCMLTQVSDEVLNKQLERLWSVDSLGEKHVCYTDSEREAMNILNESIRFDGGHYSVALPFKSDAPSLKSDFNIVRKQLCSIEKHLDKKPEKMAAYRKAMEDYVRLGFARLATPDEVKSFTNGPEYIIPHHPVERMESLTTKLRVVFNASAKDSNGNSLNECLLAGPALQPDILHVLLRFRTHRVALMADVEKMFCQTGINPEYYRYQQYLWRDCNESEDPKRYIMTRVMFGVTPSPFLAIGSMRHHVGQTEMSNRFPHACAAILQDMYVDDYCGGGSTEDEVKNLCRELRDVLQIGGWTITKFVSNSKRVMEDIPLADRLLEKIVDISERTEGVTKALGISWRVHDDAFQFKLSDKLKEPLSLVTKRTILSKVSQIFDIFGFYSAFLIRAKLIIQTMWSLGISWDDAVGETIEKQFRLWENEIVALSSIDIPRIVLSCTSRNCRLQLHIFSDASERAYGAFAYVRSDCLDGQFESHLLLSKVKVAPLKRKTIPRLELLGAHLAVRLSAIILNALRVEFQEVRFWTDSEIVLYWIRRPSSTWKEFVANRVQEIQDESKIEQWSHVPGEENPADIGSRGCSVRDLVNNSLYWHGPEWLKREKQFWPQRKQIFESVPGAEYETKKSSIVLIGQVEENDWFTRIEKYAKIVRVLVYMLVWSKRLPPLMTGRLGSDHFQLAEFFLLRKVQLDVFADEYTALKNGLPVSKQSTLLSLNPIWEVNSKLIVVGGRLEFSAYSEEFKHPAILPSSHVIVEKLIAFYHERLVHAGVETTLARLRQRFWIVHGRRAVGKVIRRCVICRHHQTRPLMQRMAPLPIERVQLAPAFTTVGLDFTGPLYIKASGSHTKVYVCIFTCATSRMVHFELVHTMETEEFLQAFRRMSNRRGLPRMVISDNQTTFRKADRLLKSSSHSDFAIENGIRWKFIVERSPHQGGFYERLNCSLKKPLRKVLGKALLSYTEMYTVLTDIESSINQRPLTYLTPNASEPPVITPAHLALGRSLAPFPAMDKVNVSPGVRYKYIEKLLVAFWNRWATEYLPKLQERSKWRHLKPELHLNDIVLISEDNVPRKAWPIGRVADVIKSKDGIVRTVKIQTNKGIYTRPIQKLHLFEAYQEFVGKQGNELDSSNSAHLISNELSHGNMSQGPEDVRKPDENTRTRSGRVSRRPERYGVARPHARGFSSSGL